MTWGEQNTENEAFQQMDMAFDYGVNFFDTAELYPIPPSEKTQGETSRIISRWIKSKNNRNKIIIADKIVGRSKMDWFSSIEKIYPIIKGHIHLLECFIFGILFSPSHCPKAYCTYFYVRVA